MTDAPLNLRIARCLSWLPVVAVALVGCSSGQPQAPATQPPASEPAAAAPAPPAVTPHLSVNALMVTMVDNAGHVLWDAEKPEFKPRNAADWTEIEDHATQLAAASTLIQLGGTGPSDKVWAQDARWQADAQKMGEAAMAAGAAAKQKNLEALVAANSTLVESCEGCHKAFKPDLPTEGVIHQRPHSEAHGSNR
jgi:cytochrome c556